ncbi:MAG TPA: aminotransferase class I/II-fold pyridoxal phosphate-dependent enzyme [Rhodothermales bacterium]|nr:aminotransferase class I/II-fold pyridoxal phosphate-dependent enzyme [Rhodothermales bacterium]
MPHFETKAIRTQANRSQHREHSVPIFATSSFLFDDAEMARALFAEEVEGNIYSRYSNPNTNEFIEKMCLLEGTEAGIATASGMAAMFMSMATFLGSGDHIVASRSLFGSTYQLLTKLFPRWGITHTFVDITAPPVAWDAAIRPETKMIFVETPSNPGLDLLDLAFLGNLAHSKGIILNVDNCFATPYVQNPAEYGAHLVTHSATKLIDGQGRVLGGCILGKKELIQEILFLSRHTGPAMSPFNGWILSKSLETLAIRVERHSENARQLAHWLEQQDGIQKVKYPFLASHPQYELAKKQMRSGGAMLTLALEGGLDQAQKFMDALSMISLSSNLGDTRTIATHPMTTTHSKLSEGERLAVGISPGLIRISVGLEHVEDIQADLAQALKLSLAT